MEGTPPLTRLIEAEGAEEPIDGRVAESDLSFDQVQSALYRAINPRPATVSPVEDTSTYIREVYDDYVIVSSGGKLWRRSYAIDAEGKVTLGDPVEVVEQKAYVKVGEGTEPATTPAAPAAETPFSESVDTSGALVLSEAQGGKGKGNVFEVLAIQPGTSKNRRRYTSAVLEAATPLFEGARSFASDGPDHDPRKRGVKAVVGWWSAPEYRRDVELPNGKVAEGVVAKYHVTDRDLADTLRESLEGGKPDLITFSIVGSGQTSSITEGGQRIADVTRIDSIESVDPVIHAAAGGMAVRLVASSEEPTMEWDTLTLAEAIKALAAGKITGAELRENRQDLADAIEKGIDAPAAPAPAAPATAPAAAPAATVAEAVTPESVDALIEARFAPIRTAEITEAALAARPALPAKVKDRIRSATKGKAMTEAEVTALVESEVEYLAALNPAAVKDSGAAQASDMKSERERIVESVYDILSGKSNDSVKRLYVDLTGDRSFSGHLAEGGRLTEAIDSTTFADIMGDSITRRMLDIYRLPDLNAWRSIVNVVPAQDFRTQHRTRMGGYGNLPSVAEGAAYTALTSPGDEDATYAVAKKGGTEVLTMETIVNDDLGAIRQLPVRLGRAAAQTLHEFVFDFVKSNPTIYDSVALFHATHGNLGSTALDATTLTAGRTAMLKQTDMSNSKRLSIRPRYLLVPIDLEQTAFELTQTDREVASANNTLNFIRQFGLTVIVVEYWTDANNWFLVGDPNLQPTIEIGFLGGREEPELFLQDQPTNGSVFTNDKLTYKVRHIYGGNVMDYRPFYGAVVA